MISQRGGLPEAFDNSEATIPSYGAKNEAAGVQNAPVLQQQPERSWLASQNIHAIRRVVNLVLPPWQACDGLYVLSMDSALVTCVLLDRGYLKSGPLRIGWTALPIPSGKT